MNPKHYPIPFSSLARAFGTLGLAMICGSAPTLAAAPSIASRSPLVDATGVVPGARVRAEIKNGDTKVQVGSVQLWIESTNVTAAATVAATTDGATVAYQPPAFWPLDTTVSVALVFRDDATPSNVVSNRWSFKTVASITTLPASYALPVASAKEPGFSVRTSQSTSCDNTTAWTERQLAGVNPVVHQSYETPMVINYLGSGGTGNFGGDSAFPNLIQNGDNTALEAVSYLHLKRGSYRFGVNSDDGFRVTAGTNAHDIGVVLGEFNGGRGASDTLFDFLVEKEGLYPFRLTFEEGYGGYALEWFSVDIESGTRQLINDTNSPLAVLAYRYTTQWATPVRIDAQPQSIAVLSSSNATFQVHASSGEVTNLYAFAYQWQVNGTNIPWANRPSYTTGLLDGTTGASKYRCLVYQLGYPGAVSDEATVGVLAPVITSLTPAAQSAGVYPDASLKVEILNRQTSVNTSTVQLWVAGTDLTPKITIQQADGRVSVGFVPVEFWPVNTKLPVTLIYQDDQATPNRFTNVWEFTTVPSITTIPQAFALDASRADTSGFFVRTSQSSSSQNSTAWSESQLAGVNPVISAGSETPLLINYLGSGGAGNFGGDRAFPGLLSGDNFALEAVAYLKLDRGVHRFGVNSDDGFRVSVGATPQQVTLVLGEFNGPRGVSDTLFDFLVEKPGLYPFRLTFQEGVGGYALEWFSVDMSTGVRSLINDVASSKAVLAYQWVKDLANPLTLVAGPQGQTVTEFRSARFEARFQVGTNINPGNLFYQWQRDDTNIAGAIQPVYVTPLVKMGDSGSKYRCLATLAGYPSVASAAATLTVSADTVAPTLMMANMLTASGQVLVKFDERVDLESATNAANYQLSNGSAVLSSTLQSDAQTVLLQSTEITYTNLALQVNNVKDLAGHPIQSSSAIAVQCLNLEAQDVGTPGVDPAERGSTLPVGVDAFDVVAGGSAVWNNADGLHFVFEPLQGDFDVWVRVDSMEATDPWTAAGLMARESLSAGSRQVYAGLNNPKGMNQYGTSYRAQTQGGSAAWVGGNHDNLNVTLPDAWIRLKREGNVFSAYRGTNGTDWLVFAQMTFDLSTNVYVGLGTTANNNASGKACRVSYRQYSRNSTIPNPLIRRTDLLVNKTPLGPQAFSADNRYQLVVADNQTARESVIANEGAQYEVRIQNDGSYNAAMVVRAAESSETGWRVVYRQGETDVTGDLFSPGGYKTEVLKPGASQTLSIIVSPGPSPAGATTKTVTLQVFAESDSRNPRDTIRAVTTATPVRLPDLLIRRSFDLNLDGNNLYNLTGAGQSKLMEVETGVEAVFFGQVQNDGNTPSRIALQASDLPAGWDTQVWLARSVLRFDGGDDYVELGNWSPGTRWTAEAWVKPTSTPGGRHSILGGYASYRDWGVTLQDGQFGVSVRTPGGGATSYRSGEAVQVGQWYHVAGVCDGTNAYLYVNGVLKQSGPVDPNYTAAETVRIAGEVCCAGNNFPGYVQEARVWSRAVLAEELTAIQAGSVTPDAPGLAGWWWLGQDNGTTLTDLSTNAHTGTLVNGPIRETLLNETGDGIDLTSMLSGAGYTNLVLQPGASRDLVIALTPLQAQAAGSVGELSLKATALEEPARQDLIKVSVTVAHPSSTAEKGFYTSNVDFEKGRVVGVEYASVPNQLQLSDEPVAFPYLWVPNSNEGTVSKVDTRTGRELGRYRVNPNGDANPSRTTVDLKGNCWVGNRSRATAVKIGLYENGQYIDRNGNGFIETSMDLNGDGDITGDEMLPWGQDECVLYEILLVPGKEKTYAPGTPGVEYANDYWNPGPRGFAVDAKDNVWIGTYGTRMFYYVDGASGKILRSISTAPVNHTCYGSLITAPDGIIWSSGQDKNHVLRFNPANDEMVVVAVPHLVYGLGLDLDQHVFVSGWQNSKLTRINALTAGREWTVDAPYEGRGVAITADGDVWVAHSGPGLVSRWSNDGRMKATIPVGNQPTGVAVDAEGKVWAVNFGDEYVKRINPDTDKIDISKRLIGTTHYGYSDMTGIIARNASTRVGVWSVVHNSKVLNTPWGIVSWAASEPDGTSVKVRVRSSNDQLSWSLWEYALNARQLYSTPPGKYLEVEISLQSSSPDLSPVVYDMSVVPSSQVNLGMLVYQNNFEGQVGDEWSESAVDQTPTGGRRFLGQFGNENVSLRLTNLPPHSAISVLFDLFVIRSWDGNSTTDGPDLWELNVGGGRKLVSATFNNAPAGSASFGQAYPGSFPTSSFDPRTGSAETNLLGFAYGSQGAMDAVYLLGYTVPHSAAALDLNFSASGLSTNLLEESWGIDNVRVYVTLASPARLLAVGKDGSGQFQLQLLAQPDQTYVLEGSTNLVNWMDISTNQLPTESLLLIDPQSVDMPRRFYRARQVP